MQGFGAFVSEKASVPEVRSKLKSIREFLSALVVSVQRGRPAGLLFILCCICICISLLQVFFKDDRVRVEKLIPAGSLCASQVLPPAPPLPDGASSAPPRVGGCRVPVLTRCATAQDDLYDDVKRRCQMGNKYAYAYLLGHDWVFCAPNMYGSPRLAQRHSCIDT